MRICFIGFGRRGKTLYGELLKIQNNRVSGICDPFEKGDFPAKRYSDASEMLGAEKPDLVIDATPPGNRFHNIILCNEFRIPVICEKPLFFTASQVRRLKTLKISVYPAYQLQFDSMLQKLFSLAEKEKIQSISFSQRVNLKPGGWKLQKNVSQGGALIDNGSHLINLAILKFGMPKAVFAKVARENRGIESEVDCLLFYKNFTCKIHVDWHSPVGKETRIGITSLGCDIHFFETNQVSKLWTASVDNENEWSRRREEYYYERRGLERDMKMNAFNQMSPSATQAMLSEYIHDVRKNFKRNQSAMAKKSLDAALSTAIVIKHLYASNNAGRIIKV